MAKILVADDSRLARELIKNFLEDLGHDVVYTAVDGKDAYSKYMELKPELITLDVNMPEMDGLSVARNILRHDISAKIIMITSLDEEKAKKGLTVGTNVKHIRKPLEMDLLIEALRGLGY